MTSRNAQTWVRKPKYQCHWELTRDPWTSQHPCDTSEQLEAPPPPVLNILLGSDSLCGVLGLIQGRGWGGGLPQNISPVQGDTKRSESTVLNCQNHMDSDLLQPKSLQRDYQLVSTHNGTLSPAKEPTNTHRAAVTINKWRGHHKSQWTANSSPQVQGERCEDPISFQAVPREGELFLTSYYLLKHGEYSTRSCFPHPIVPCGSSF